MPKRANPYSEDFTPRSKTHVSLKQLNSNEDGLRKVYEKTLNLLYKGAKKVSLNQNDETTYICLKKDGMKQLYIGNDGSLLHSGSWKLETKSSPTVNCCANGDKECVCAYCEVHLCASCQHLCSRCNMPYCAHCSVGSEGVAICVSCYG